MHVSYLGDQAQGGFIPSSILVGNVWIGGQTTVRAQSTQSWLDCGHASHTLFTTHSWLDCGQVDMLAMCVNAATCSVVGLEHKAFFMVLVGFSTLLCGCCHPL